MLFFIFRILLLVIVFLAFCSGLLAFYRQRFSKKTEALKEEQGSDDQWSEF